MLEYSIDDLKYYYSHYADAGADTDSDYIEKVHLLEDRLSDMIDSEYTQNSIYHLFPCVAIFVISTLFLGININNII
jgi:hypothetical protein